MNTTDHTIECDHLDKDNLTGTLSALRLETNSSLSRLAIQLVEQCPDTCNTVYGNGNPDISGIGVFISFVLLGFYYVVFGPSFGIFILLMPKRRRQEVRKTLKRFRRLFGTIHATSVFLTFSTLVAACSRMRKSLPLYEMSFLSDLCGYLGSISRSTFLVYLTLGFGLEETAISLLVFPREGLYTTCDFVNWTLADYINSNLTTQPLKRDSLPTEMVLMACVKQRNFSQPAARLTRIPWHILPLVEVAMSLIAPLAAFIALWYSPDFWDRLCGFRRCILDTQWIFSIRRILRSRTSLSILLIFVNLNGIAITTINGLMLWDTRSRMMSVNTATAQDNEWGFGQVTAVLLWFPTTVWVCWNLLRLVPWFEILNFVMGRPRGEIRFSKTNILLRKLHSLAARSQKEPGLMLLSYLPVFWVSCLGIT